MPGGRGGRRQGTPGKGYTNRTDLAVDYAPRSTATPSVSRGNATPPSAVSPGNAPPQMIYPEDVPRLNDPTSRPYEPLTEGLSNPTTSDPVLDELRAAYSAMPTPQLAHVIRITEARMGRR